MPGSYAFSGAGSLFLLVDGAKIDALPAKIYELEAAPICDALYRDTPLSGLVDISPWLVKVKANSPFLRVSFGDWKAKGAAVLWQADTSFELVLAHFKKLVMAQTSTRDEVIFRFYDPEILRSLMTGDDVGEDILRLMGPCNEVAIQDRRSGELAYFDRGLAPVEPVNTPFAIRDEHLARMEGGVAQTALRKLELHTAEYFPHLLHASTSDGYAWGVVKDLIEAARQKGLSSTRDVALYINTVGWLGLLAFEENAVAELWQMHSSKPARAIARIAEFAEQKSTEGQAHG